MKGALYVKRLSTDLRTADFDFSLPAAQIAAAPTARRDESRLLILDRGPGARKHTQFKEIAHHLPPRALLVVNDTRVLPARLRARKPSGGAVEFLLTRSMSPLRENAEAISQTWEALARGLGSRGAGPLRLDVSGRLTVTLLERGEAGRVLVELRAAAGQTMLEVLDEVGEVPLPPYIEAARRRDAGAPPVDDHDRYQTVYAAAPGAVAAPTAGLHFTPALLDEIRVAGHDIAALTLHVGPGTFRPVQVEDPTQHHLDVERYHIPRATADAVEAARAAGRTVVAVGTTVVRALEASARAPGNGGRVVAGDAETDLMLLPGDRFLVAGALVTNFHLPRSTLLMLVAAFAGRDLVLEAYREAVERGYRFYSYGDAMLIRGGPA
jgi:S-adenosylmethionine:tRNA ribosyltransferase-isomerase